MDSIDLRLMLAAVLVLEPIGPLVTGIPLEQSTWQISFLDTVLVVGESLILLTRRELVLLQLLKKTTELFAGVELEEFNVDLDEVVVTVITLVFPRVVAGDFEGLFCCCCFTDTLDRHFVTICVSASSLPLRGAILEEDLRTFGESDRDEAVISGGTEESKDIKDFEPGRSEF